MSSARWGYEGRRYLIAGEGKTFRLVRAVTCSHCNQELLVDAAVDCLPKICPECGATMSEE